MAYVGDSDNVMRPRKGDSSINLPVTFDYSGGRKETSKSKMLWVGIIGVLGLIMGIGTIFSSEGFWLVNILFGCAIIVGVVVMIRFLILKEHKVRERVVKMQEEDYIKDYRDLWGIYDMEDIYPYYAHMRNGKTAIYVQFEKDVILGKVEDSEYEHYEAIGDAYNLAGSMKIGMCHIDYMDKVGNDDRLAECFKELPNVANPDIRDILSDMYTNLQDMMDESVTTFDVYVFHFKGSETLFWYNIQQVISCMLKANYVSYKILNPGDVRELTKSLYNIHDFSVMEASSNAFESKKYSGVVPISIITYDGVEAIINKTSEEKKEERKVKERELKLKKEEGKRRKQKKKNQENTSEEEIDIFS